MIGHGGLLEVFSFTRPNGSCIGTAVEQKNQGMPLARHVEVAASLDDCYRLVLPIHHR